MNARKEHFESYIGMLLVQPSQSKEFRCRPCVGSSAPLYDVPSHVRLGGCKSLDEVDDVVASAKQFSCILFEFSDEQKKLIDFIYKDDEGIFHAFQIMRGKSYSVNESQIKHLENQIEDANDKLRLYYLVREENFATFVTNPREPNVSCRVYPVQVPKSDENKKSEK